MNRRTAWSRLLAAGAALSGGGAARTSTPPASPKYLYDPAQNVLTRLDPDNVYRTVRAIELKTYSLRDGSSFILDGTGGVRWRS
jgi:hypothetical protein